MSRKDEAAIHILAGLVSNPEVVTLSLGEMDEGPKNKLIALALDLAGRLIAKIDSQKEKPQS